MEPRLKRIHELVQGIEADGMAGLLRTVAIFRDPDPNSPSAQCIQDADNAMDSAVGNDQYYDAALGMAACLREAIMDPYPEEPDPPEEPEDPEAEPDPYHGGRGDTLADLVLAALLVRLRPPSKT